MRVPPPYVPPLGGSEPAIAGPAGYVPSPSAAVPMRPAPEPQAASSERQLNPAPASAKMVNATPRMIKAPSLRLSRREWALLTALLLSLLLLPASLPDSAVEAQRVLPSDPNLQPVERPEENFAGSAFYFIDPGYAIPQNYGSLEIDPLASPGSETGVGIAVLANDHGNPEGVRANPIRPIAFRGTAIDNSRALQCLTSAIYYEAGLESDAGQKAVAQVILNRVRHPSYPATVCGVIFQGSERQTGCQFTYTCDGSLRRKPSKFHWNRAKSVAALALSGKMASPVGTATHYHTTEVYPYWAPSLRFLGTIGAHRFYSWKGSAGRSDAFSQRYRGREPLPASKPRQSKVSTAPSLDPIALEKAYEAGRRKALEEDAKNEKTAAIAADNARRYNLPAPSATPSTTPTYRAPDYSKEAKQRGGEEAFAGQKLPGVSQIRPEYRNAGTWKKKPGI